MGFESIDQPGWSSEVECNIKMSISFSWREQGPRWGLSPSTSPANHQKLNIIQKISIFIFLAGEGWWMGFESINQPGWSSEVERNPKMSISSYDNIGGLFSHFTQILSLQSLSWSSEIEHNPKPSISFFDDLGDLSLHFSRLLLLGSLSQSSEVKCNIKMSFSFFDDLGGLFSHFGWISSLRWLSQSSLPITNELHCQEVKKIIVHIVWQS